VVREGEGLRRSASNPNRGASLCLGILEPVLRGQHVGKTHIRFLEASSALAEGSLLVNEDAPLRSRSQFPAPNCGRPKGCTTALLQSCGSEPRVSHRSEFVAVIVPALQPAGILEKWLGEVLQTPATVCVAEPVARH